MMEIPAPVASGKTKVKNQEKRRSKIREFLMALCVDDP
jgi:hypothetical protein